MSKVEDSDYLLTLFLTYILTEKRVANNTYQAYKNDLESLLNFLKKNKVSIRACAKKDLKKFLKFLNEQGVCAKTLSRKISAIKAFYNYLADRFELTNRSKDLIFPKIEKNLPVYLTEPEIEKLLQAACKDNSYKGIRNKVMLYLLYATGIRVSELVNLKIDNIDFNTGFISISGKGNKDRMIPIPKNILGLLRYYLDIIYIKLLPNNSKNIDLKNNKEFLFFATYSGKIKPLSRQSFWFILKNILKKAFILKNVSPHTLRHSLATHLLKNGADIRSLQVILGHEQLATVQIYTHLQNNDLRKIYDDKHPRA